MIRDTLIGWVGEISCLAGLALCGWLADGWEKENLGINKGLARIRNKGLSFRGRFREVQCSGYLAALQRWYNLSLSRLRGHKRRNLGLGYPRPQMSYVMLI